MGRKVHPIGFRIGGIRDWQAKWYAEKHFADYLHEDLKLRQAIQSGYVQAGISQIQIDRQANKVSVTIHTARPGVVIGRGGQRVDQMRQNLESLIGKKILLNIQEIQQPELDAYLVARVIAGQIESRIAYRRAMKQAISRTIMAGAKGVRVSCSGRLGGAEIARRLTMHEGQVPLHTLRADIDYGLTEAKTTLGLIGIKVWIYKGDILPERELVEAEEVPPELVAITAEPIEKPEEPVAAESIEVAPEVKPEEKPAKPATRRRVKKAVSIEPEEPITAESIEVAPEVKPEEKPAKPATRRRVKKAVSIEPEELVAAESIEVAPEVKPEEKPAKPAARRRVKKVAVAEPEKNATQPAVDTTTEAEASTLKKKEEKDATTQAGEIPQDSQGTPQR